MAFRRPLNAFLSYSHADTVLFNAFKKHLKSLADDKLIVFWHDQMITAGREWNDEISNKLETADLFIALTSANFNASEYIEDVEMTRAIERHADGQCRIIPVMGVAWDPPQSLSKYQLLPSMDQPIGSPDNAQALTAVNRGIRKAIDEMLNGEWPGLSGHRTSAARPAVTRPRLPDDLPYLCDWTDPISRVRRFRPDRGAQQRSPCVLIVRATDQDGPEAFLRRIRRDHLAETFGLPVRDPIQMDWPSWREQSDFDDLVCMALHANPKRNRKTQLAEGLTILETGTGHDLSGARLKRHLEEYLGYWKDWSPLPAGRGLLTTVTLLYPDREQMNSSVLEETLQKAVPEGVRAVTIDLPEVHGEDAVRWASLPPVKSHYREEHLPVLSQEIRGLFTGGRPRPMLPLAPALLDILERRR